MLSPLQVFIQHRLLRDLFPDSLARPGSPLTLPACSALCFLITHPPISFHVSLCCLLSPRLIQQLLLIHPCVPGTVLDKLLWGQGPGGDPCSSPCGRSEPGRHQGCLHHDIAAKVRSLIGVSQSRVVSCMKTRACFVY